MPRNDRQSQVGRVTLVVDRMAVGGKERVVMHLASGLQRCGWTVQTVCMRDLGPLGQQMRASGLTVHELQSNRSCDVRAIWKLRRILSEFRGGVVNVHDRSSLPYVTVAGIEKRWPVILTCHGLTLGAPQRAKWIQRWSARRAKAVTAVSDSVGQQFQAMLDLPVPVEIIANGVPMHPVDLQAGQAFRAEMCLPHDATLLLAVGNVLPEKGYEDLIEACAIVRRRMSRPFVVAIAGDWPNDDYLRQLRSMSAAAELNGTVRFLGFRSDTAALYAGADVMVMSSRTEGLPMALLEAMSFGRPVVATAVGGVPQVLARSGCGVLAEPGNPQRLAEAIMEMLSNPRRAQMGADGIDDVRRHYSLDAMIGNYARLYARAAETMTR